MGSFYTPEHRALQDRFVTRRLADTQERAIVSERLSEADRTFIAERDMLFLSTTDATGQPTVSYKGGAPGFEADDPDPRDRFADGGDPSLKATTSLCDTLRTFALNLRDLRSHTASVASSRARHRSKRTVFVRLVDRALNPWAT